MKGKVVIVTGATKGMGFEVAKSLIEKEALVVLVYRFDVENAKRVENQLKDYTKRFLHLKADIAKKEDRKKIVAETIEKFHRIDVLVNNAAIAAKESFLKLTEQEYDNIMSVNVKGPMFLAKLVCESMIQKKISGSIINFSSISGHRGTGGISYDASKAAVINATKSMAVAVGKYGIRVNSISPGYHMTEMNRYHWENKTKMHEGMIKVIPLERAADASEICGVVEFLISGSTYVTGTDILADGGYLAVCRGRD